MAAPTTDPPERLPGYTHEETKQILLAGSVRALRDSLYEATAREPSVLFLPPGDYRPGLAEFLGIPVVVVKAMSQPMLGYAVAVAP